MCESHDEPMVLGRRLSTRLIIVDSNPSGTQDELSYEDTSGSYLSAPASSSDSATVGTTSGLSPELPLRWLTIKRASSGLA